MTLEIRRAPDQAPLFNVNVESRPVVLSEPLPTPWRGVWVDSLPDNLAAKMTALVRRGIPRDFRDIFEVCAAGLTTPAECWLWFSRRNPEAELQLAKMAVMRNLAEIESRRPLHSLSNNERAAATHLRNFFKHEFC